MTIPWAPITKYSLVALSSSCLTAGICLATVNQVGEGEKEQLPDNLIDSEKEIEDIEHERPEQKIEKLKTRVKELADKANNQGAKLHRYLLKDHCYETEIKRQLAIGSRWWYGDRVDQLVKKCEQYKINI